MGAIFGGGSTASAPTTTGLPTPGRVTAYQPTAQPGADISFQDINNQLLNQYQTGSTPAQQLWQPAANTAIDYYQNAALTPFFDQLINNVAGSPYYGQAQTAAGTAANIGAGAAGDLSNVYQNSLSTIPGLQQSLGNEAGLYAPLISNLALNTSQLSPDAAALSAQTQALAPQYTNLLSSLTSNIPQVQNLGLAASTYASPTIDLASQIAGLQPTFSGLGAQAAGTQPAFNQLAGGVSGTLPAYGAGAQNILSALPGIGQQAQFFQQLEQQPAGAQSLQAGADRIMNTAFDPQNALFNQLTAQTRDQANAINAMSGVGTTPYGAGVTANALGNLDINWQNQQLARQAQGLGAAGGALGQAQGLLQGRAGFGEDVLGALTTGAGLNTQALNALTAGGGQAATAGGLYGQGLGALGAAGSLYGQGVNTLGQAIGGYGTGTGILGQAGGLYGQAGNLAGLGGNLLTGQAGLNTQALNQLIGAGGLNTAAAGQYGTAANQLANASNIYGQATPTALQQGQLLSGLSNLAATSGALPQQTYSNFLQQQLAAQNAKLGALSGVIPQLQGATNLGTQQYGIPQQVLNNLTNYLQLGQGASLAGGSLGQLGSNEQQANLSNLGALTGATSGLLFGNQGLGGALGLGSTGLLGAGGLGLLGGGATSAADQSLLDVFASSPFAPFSLLP